MCLARFPLEELARLLHGIRHHDICKSDSLFPHLWCDGSLKIFHRITRQLNYILCGVGAKLALKRFGATRVLIRCQLGELPPVSQSRFINSPEYGLLRNTVLNTGSFSMRAFILD